MINIKNDVTEKNKKKNQIKINWKIKQIYDHNFSLEKLCENNIFKNALEYTCAYTKMFCEVTDVIIISTYILFFTAHISYS